MGLGHQFLLLLPNSSRILNPIIKAKGKLKERTKADFRLAFCAKMIFMIRWDTDFIRKHHSHIKKLWELTVTVRNFRVVISTASFSALLHRTVYKVLSDRQGRTLFAAALHSGCRIKRARGKSQTTLGCQTYTKHQRWKDEELTTAQSSRWRFTGCLKVHPFFIVFHF